LRIRNERAILGKDSFFQNKNIFHDERNRQDEIAAVGTAYVKESLVGV